MACLPRVRQLANSSFRSSRAALAVAVVLLGVPGAKDEVVLGLAALTRRVAEPVELLIGTLSKAVIRVVTQGLAAREVRLAEVLIVAVLAAVIRPLKRSTLVLLPKVEGTLPGSALTVLPPAGPILI